MAPATPAPTAAVAAPAGPDVAAALAAPAGAGAQPASFIAAVALGMVVPGAGHLALGRYGPGLARVMLFAVWLVGGVLLAVGASSWIGGVPLLAGVLVLWVTGPADLARVRAGGVEVLGARGLLWLVVAVTTGAAAGLLVTAAA